MERCETCGPAGNARAALGGPGRWGAGRTLRDKANPTTPRLRDTHAVAAAAQNRPRKLLYGTGLIEARLGDFLEDGVAERGSHLFEGGDGFRHISTAHRGGEGRKDRIILLLGAQGNLGDIFVV